MSTPENWSQVEAASSAMPVLGYTCFWNLQGLAVPHQALVDGLEAHSLEAFAPPRVTPPVALRRALNAMLRDKVAGLAPTVSGNVDEETRIMVRERTTAGSEWFMFALVAETADMARLGFEYATEARIKIHKKSGTLLVSEDASGDITEANASPRLTAALLPYWEHYRELHTARDISVVVRSIVGWLAALSLRAEGGIYFVHPDRYDELMEVRAWLDSLTGSFGGDDTFLVIGVPDADGAKARLAHAAHRDLAAQVTAAEEALQDVLGDPKSRRTTVIRRLADVCDLSRLVSDYTTLLDMKSEDISRRLERLQSMADAVLQATTD